MPGMSQRHEGGGRQCGVHVIHMYGEILYVWIGGLSHSPDDGRTFWRDAISTSSSTIVPSSSGQAQQHN